MSEKPCFKCGQTKPLSDFYTHPRMKDGHLNKCKTCAKLDTANWYEDTFEARRKYEVERFKRPSRKDAVSQYQRKRRKAFPEKDKARNAVSNAVRDGRLIRGPCVKCGATKSQAHHHDYSKPLDVMWLCFKCHRLEHGQINVVH